MDRAFRRLLILLMAPLLFACTQMVTVNGGTSVPAEGTESVYNATPVPVTGNKVIVTSLAQFSRFNDYDLASEKTTSCTSGAPCKKGLVSTSTFPIRRAEVHIYRVSSGALVQAGETDGSGNISLQVPVSAGTYRLEVHSRSDNNYLKASVLNNPYDKKYYSIAATFVLTGSETNNSTKSVTLGTAPYNGTLEGGAFNILHDLYLSNQFLRDHANGNTNTSGADYCPSSVCDPMQGFTVAPKVSAYWTKGVTPYAYAGDPTAPISFFVPTAGGGLYPGLYILGGIEGDICTDTDHYDNSVIVHEYGHFLEHTYATSDSPGGSHNGNKIIDPRLAWSEGWADFFQAAVLGRTVYRDTQRNAECAATSIGMMGEYYTSVLSFTDFNMEAQTADVPTRAGEGNFREISVARSLYDTITGSNQASPLNNNTDGVAANLGFAVVWNSFKKLSSSLIFNRNIGHINQYIYDSLSGWAGPGSTTTFDSVLSNELQRRDRKDFGHTLTRQSGGTCTGTNSSWAPWKITSSAPNQDQIYSDYSIKYSDQFNNNDFYLYYYDGSAANATIKLKYDKDPSYVGAYTQPWDLDLYAYKMGYTFMSTSDIVRSSEGYFPETTNAIGSNPGLETLNFSGLSAGYYMINVKVFYVAEPSNPNPSRKADTTYYFEFSNGDRLCP